jgi:hypothetical protein
MSKPLLESDFLTTDLGALAKKSAAVAQNQVNRPTAKNTEAANDSSDISTQSQIKSVKGWGEVLEARLAANKALSSEARKSDYEIESKFFKEYYKNGHQNWKNRPNVTTQLLLMGGPLKKAIKVLGFNEKTNPILAFITNSFVVEKLIDTKLLNDDTFKAIYNAVAKKLVAQSQFKEANSYNIIYCPELYRKTASEILEYLDLQNNVLPANATKYTKDMLNLNKKIFMSLPEITAEELSKMIAQLNKLDVSTKSISEAKLNTLQVATALEDKLNNGNMHNNKNTTGSNQNRQTVASSQKQLIKVLNTPAKKLAALQYIVMTTNNAKAKEALMSDKLKNIPKNDLMAATSLIANSMSKYSILAKDADSVVKLLLDNL